MQGRAVLGKEVVLILHYRNERFYEICTIAGRWCCIDSASSPWNGCIDTAPSHRRGYIDSAPYSIGEDRLALHHTTGDFALTLHLSILEEAMTQHHHLEVRLTLHHRTREVALTLKSTLSWRRGCIGSAPSIWRGLIESAPSHWRSWFDSAPSPGKIALTLHYRREMLHWLCTIAGRCWIDSALSPGDLALTLHNRREKTLHRFRHPFSSPDAYFRYAGTKAHKNRNSQQIVNIFLVVWGLKYKMIVIFIIKLLYNNTISFIICNTSIRA